MIPFTNFRDLHAERVRALAQQREGAARQAAETVNLLASVVQSPGYKVLKEALLASADGEHQKALSSKDAHSMAIALGAESAFRSAAHAAEDIIASSQTTIQAMKAK